MKRSLLFAAAIAVVSIVHGQFEKGSILLGGNIGFGESRGEISGDKTNTVIISPSVGVGIAANTFAGVSVIYSHAKLQTNVALLNENKLAGGSLFLRRYVPLGKGFYVFGEGDVNGQHSTNFSDNGTVTTRQKITGFGISAYPGLAFGATKSLQLEIGLPNLLSLNYSRAKLYNNDQAFERTNSVNFSVAASSFAYISLGFRFLIPR